MKALIAIDSFKGSLSSLLAGNAAAEGIKRVYNDAETIVLPIADGGEGTVDALVKGLSGEKRQIIATDPLGRKIPCEYGIIGKNTAVIEMSSAAGITLISDEERNPLNTTTFGVGEIIIDAIRVGCRNFVIGIGGSATNDGGIGMLQALGFGILDKNGNQVPFGAKGLELIDKISCENVLPELSECVFKIACDVTNPLCGEKGCSAVFGPQKGADREIVKKMDAWLSGYADIVKKVFENSDKDALGAGAAGGMGFAFMSFLNAKLESGISLILNLIKIEDYIKKTDVVITGEGRLDSQTVMGKAPIGIANIAKKYSKPVFAFAGCITNETRVCNNNGIDAYFQIVKGACSLEEAMDIENAKLNMADTVEQVFRLVKTVKVFS